MTKKKMTTMIIFLVIVVKTNKCFGFFPFLFGWSFDWTSSWPKFASKRVYPCWAGFWCRAMWAFLTSLRLVEAVGQRRPECAWTVDVVVCARFCIWHCSGRLLEIDLWLFWAAVLAPDSSLVPCVWAFCSALCLCSVARSLYSTLSNALVCRMFLVEIKI